MKMSPTVDYKRYEVQYVNSVNCTVKKTAS